MRWRMVARADFAPLAALLANRVRKFVFQPTMEDGQPVEVTSMPTFRIQTRE